MIDQEQENTGESASAVTESEADSNGSASAAEAASSDDNFDFDARRRDAVDRYQGVRQEFEDCSQAVYSVLQAALAEEDGIHKLRTRRSSEGPIFPNRNGQRQSVGNIERRMKTAIRRANTRIAELGIRPIDEAVTPHSLRRLYASLRFALGDDPVYVAAQLGHAEPGFSMKVYASAVRRRERLIGAALREFDAALEWAEMGSGEPVSVDSEPTASAAQSPDTAQQSLFTA